MRDVDAQKRAAGEAAALLVRDGTTVGLGTGSTVAFFLTALARRRLALRCVATSPQTERAALDLGLPVVPFDDLDRLDLAVDGADQVGPDRWLVKGGHGAQTREKVVAAAAERFVVIVSEEKLVDGLRPPVPLEVLRFGLGATLRQLSEIGPCRVRDTPPSPEGNAIVDHLGPVEDPAALARAFDAVPGVVGHGLFPPSIVGEILVGGADGAIEHR
jgi:ribose 5-phosphate isomerase A